MILQNFTIQYYKCYKNLHKAVPLYSIIIQGLFMIQVKKITTIKKT